MKNQGGCLKVPLFERLATSCVDAKISMVPKHQLMVPLTLLAPGTHIRTEKATKIHTLRPLTYELCFQNSSTTLPRRSPAIYTL